MGDTVNSTNFREHIRQYNSANAFASFGAIMADIPGHGPYCFKISGEVYHLATSALLLNPTQPQQATPQPSYGQLFALDPDGATAYRMSVATNSECNRMIMATIDQVLRQLNPYAAEYKRLHEVTQEEEARANGLAIPAIQYELRLMRNSRDDQRRYNLPTTNKECMYLVQTSDGDVPAMDLAVHPRGQHVCMRLFPESRHADPMVFPVFFPHGDAGYHTGI